jgi:hypothetical protein
MDSPFTLTAAFRIVDGSYNPAKIVCGEAPEK